MICVVNVPDETMAVLLFSLHMDSLYSQATQSIYVKDLHNSSSTVIDFIDSGN